MNITITKELAYECAKALVDKHNNIPQDEAHDNCILFSFRELYMNLCKLGQEYLIATAIKPINKYNRPLFLDADGKPLK